MKLIRNLNLSITFVVLIVGWFTTDLVNADPANFSTETSTLSIPLVNVDGITLYKDAQLKLDFATQTFTLDALGNIFTSSSKPFNPVIELEPNNALADAQLLTEIGANSPINAGITQIEDEDWYYFKPEAEQTYVVELFDVDWKLAKNSGSDCRRSYEYSGLGLVMYDQNETQFIDQCKPANGIGNAHNSLAFNSLGGIVYIKVKSNVNTALGNYKMRILPKHDSSNAIWDKDTFEPNNWTANAYAIKPGANNALI